MAPLNGFDMIERVKDFRSEDASYLTKLITGSVHDITSSWFTTLDEQSRLLFIEETVKYYCNALKSLKLARALQKILTSLPKSYERVVNEQLTKAFLDHLCAEKNISQLRTLSGFLDQSDVARQESRKSFGQMSEVIHESFRKREEQTDSEFLHCVIKLCIQVIQVASDFIKLIFAGSRGKELPSEQLERLDESDKLTTETFWDEQLSDCLFKHWEGILTSLLSILTQTNKTDLLMMTGTAVGMLFNLATSVPVTRTAFIDLMDMLTIGKPSISFNQIQFTNRCVLSGKRVTFKIPLLAVIKGILVCSCKDVLSHAERPLFLVTYSHILSLCSDSSSYHYLSFQILALWYQKLEIFGTEPFQHKSFLNHMCSAQNAKDYDNDRVDDPEPLFSKTVSESDSVFDDRFEKRKLFHKSCPIISSTLSCLWLNWDNPVEGVTEYVVDIFRSMLSIWNQALAKGLSDYTDLSKVLMKKVITMSWHTRSRYRPMCLLLPYVDSVQTVTEYEKLADDLLKCMERNDMAAIASDVYKAFLEQLGKVTTISSVDTWLKLWMPTLLKGLTSPNNQQQLKTCIYWLQPTLCLIKGSEKVVLQAIEQSLFSEGTSLRTQWLFAWISVCQTARDVLDSFEKLPSSPYLLESLTCQDDDVRSGAFMFLCSTLKRAKPVSTEELNLIKEFVPINLKTDSTSFRQGFTLAMKKLVIRIRDSCLSAIKANTLSDSCCAEGIDFIDWLFQMLVENLTPGGTYQRRKTTLDLMGIVLEHLVYQERHYHRKGKAQEEAVLVFRHAQSQRKWNFFCHDNFVSLFACLEDGAVEIQDQCAKILLSYFTWPSSLCLQKHGESQPEWENKSCLATKETIIYLINKSFSLNASPKSFENHTAVILTSFIFVKYVIALNVQFGYTSSFNDVQVTSISIVGEPNQTPPSLLFLDMLVSVVSNSLAILEKDFNTAFRKHPIHGFTQCIVRCLQEITKAHLAEVDAYSDGFAQRLKTIANLYSRMVNLVLAVLSGGETLNSCPSFADIGVALSSRLAELDLDSTEENPMLSPDVQLLLSWCWINLKESYSCLSQVVVSSVEQDRCLISVEAIAQLGEAFVKVFTLCRHRGAIEGCRNGFSQFCASLLSSKVTELSDIPKAILKKTMQTLTQDIFKASVSRRSAGLPIVIQTVVSQAIKICGDVELLKATVEQLYDVASKRLPSNHNEQKDLSQSHALNILKVLFCDSSLSSQLTQLLSKLIILVTKGFDSPCWAIRNAATQLISILITRLFGQGQNESSMTLEEFESLHPDLLAYVSDKLHAFACSRKLVHPSLYIVLTILSKLAMAPSFLHHSSYRHSMQNDISVFLSSPVHSLRNLSSKALLSFCPMNAGEEILQYLMEKLKTNLTQFNSLHGNLLALHHLVLTDTLSENVYMEVVHCLVQVMHTVTEASRCFTPIALILRTVQVFLTNLKDTPTEFLHKLWSFIETLISKSTQSSSRMMEIGWSDCCAESVRVLALIATSKLEYQDRFICFSCFSVVEGDADLRESVISSLLQANTKIFQQNCDVQSAIFRNLLKETLPSIFLKSVNLLSQQAVGSGHLLVDPKELCNIDLKDFQERLGNSHSIQHGMLILQALMIQNAEDSSTVSRMSAAIHDWCHQILQLSEPQRNENSRMADALCLLLAGKKVFDFFSCNQHEVSIENELVSLVRAILNLLQDPDSEVRRSMTKFISNFIDLRTTHTNLAYNEFTQLISTKLSWSSQLHMHLLEVLHSPGQFPAAISSAVTSGSQRLFETEEESTLAEGYALKLWAFKTLMAMCTIENSTVSLQFDSSVHSASTELRENLPVIQKVVEGHSLLNLSNHHLVLTSLMGIVLIKVLAQKTGYTSDSFESLKMDVQELCKMMNLHPLLRHINTESNLQQLLTSV